jgi:hypothetical protein
MAALTSQDYKAHRRGARDTRRLRDFGYGTACGAVLASIAFICLGTRGHAPKVQAQVPPHDVQRVPGVDASGAPGAAGSGTIYTFPGRLSGSETAVTLPAEDPRQEPPAEHHGTSR